MSTSHTRCVIDAGGYYVTFVHVDTLPDGSLVPRAHVLKDGESLVEATPPTAGGFIGKARWVNGAFIDTATEAEVAAWKADRIEGIRTQKMSAMKTACDQAIAAGIEVETSEGTKRFTLADSDLTQLMGLKPQLDELVAAGDMETPTIPYHPQGELCRHWSAADFANILAAATNHTVYHRTYHNHLEAWVRREEDYDTLDAITYGTELPPDLQTKLDKIVGIPKEEA